MTQEIDLFTEAAAIQNEPQLTLPQKLDRLNNALNSPPKEEWLKEYNGLKYLPIERVGSLLRVIFGRFRVDVIDFKVMANSIAVHVRLYVIDPATGEWMQQDGLGAVPIKTNKGAGAMDFEQMKFDAIQTGLPAAKSFAIKDAAELYGRVFGSDINRKEEAIFVSKTERTWERILKA